ncbi:MAG: glycosyltransferase family 4 protein [Chloroflexi bacterium]|nr:MAG: glycosyltransferase family 4 protein [Chloroflexota bacterium]TME47706.1 MAG: glycosyltransferase family 4 protein [Chloroflexota bacterium]
MSRASDGLRIGIVAPPWYPLPPSGYGGTELVVHLLHGELRRMGHDVVVFGAEGSEPDVVAIAKAEWSHDLGGHDEAARLSTYLARVFASIQGERFDVLHDHAGYEGTLLALHSGVAPVVVHTIHGELLEPMCTFYREVMLQARLCAISVSQAASAPALKFAGIVHNAVEIPAAPPSTTHERYLIEVARITPDKGQHLAIRLARSVGRKLILAGKVERSGEGARYFEEQVEPYLGPGVEYYPNVAGSQKTKLISRAAAGVFPLQWSEPFGLAMAECMVAGTPVIALRTGSTPELIEHGVTGFLAEDMDGLIEAARHIHEIDRVRCADVARERFGPRNMAERYLEVYRRGSVSVEPFVVAAEAASLPPAGRTR